MCFHWIGFSGECIGFNWDAKGLHCPLPSKISFVFVNSCFVFVTFLSSNSLSAFLNLRHEVQFSFLSSFENNKSIFFIKFSLFWRHFSFPFYTMPLSGSRSKAENFRLWKYILASICQLHFRKLFFQSGFAQGFLSPLNRHKQRESADYQSEENRLRQRTAAFHITPIINMGNLTNFQFIEPQINNQTVKHGANASA